MSKSKKNKKAKKQKVAEVGDLVKILYNHYGWDERIVWVLADVGDVNHHLRKMDPSQPAVTADEWKEMCRFVTDERADTINDELIRVIAHGVLANRFIDESVKTLEQSKLDHPSAPRESNDSETNPWLAVTDVTDVSGVSVVS